MLKSAVKELAGSFGFDVIRRNGGGNASLSRGVISRFQHQGQEVTFFIADEWDYIQSHHLKGCFYETEELGLIARHFRGGVFVDVGANIGNHAIYALKFLEAEKVIAFEPNPAAARLLHINLALNGLSAKVDHRPVGLCDRDAQASLIAPRHKDLGSTRLELMDGASESTGCPVTTGDAALANEPMISMIKIDTEAMELEVLAGLSQTLARHRPTLFVEVDDANRDAFLSFAKTNAYEVAATYRRYETNCNYLLEPKA
ncbi:MAG: FkbM family methyltransferase [Hyphomicrobiaceae bacterium]